MCQEIIKTPQIKLPEKIDLIWNHTRVCPHPCPACSVAAIHVQNHESGARVFSPDLATEMQIPRHPGETRYSAAQRWLQGRGDELTYARKLCVLDNLAGFHVRVDLSGGDALVTADGLPLLSAVSARLGRSNVSLTITGAGVKWNLVDAIAELIGELNFTFDAATNADATVRPTTYASTNLKFAKRVQSAGVVTRAEFPITKAAACTDHLRRLYLELAEAQVDKLLLMRYFNVGRGSANPEYLPSRQDYLRTITTMRELEHIHKRPAIRLQCALRHIEEQANPVSANPCDLGHASYGLMADGTLLASPWAINMRGQPLDQAWVLGNLADTPLSEILLTPKSQAILARVDENYGHCKIFSYLHS